MLGSFKGLPKYTAAAVTRSTKAECSPYQDFATAYSKSDEDLRKAVNSHQQAFADVRCQSDLHVEVQSSALSAQCESMAEVGRQCDAEMQDGNTGLVKLALNARTMRAIQKLTQTYLTLSLADIAAQVGLGSAAEAEQHILR